MSTKETTHACRFCSRAVPLRDHLENEAMTFAMMFELAANFVEQFSSISDAAIALEAEALKLRRKWSRLPVKAPGEREYQSWFREEDESVAKRFAHVEVSE
jgi:hypothetical protein